jgi:PPM family protein phosphatase
MAETAGPLSPEADFDIALLSDPGTDRPDNEDACGHFLEGPQVAVIAVADGIGGYEGGEVASRMAVEITLEAYRESPAAWGAAKRLHRAVQRANIEIHNRALAVPELRRMGTTLTAAVVESGMLTAAHVGDCRLYLGRRDRLLQLSKDHTAVAERVRMGLLSAQRARNHPERSVLNRSVGHELIVSVDRISIPLLQGDRVLLCSDGLYGVLEDREIQNLLRQGDASAVCKALVEAANSRGTADNLTAAVFVMRGATPYVESAGAGSWRGWLRGLLGRQA